MNTVRLPKDILILLGLSVLLSVLRIVLFDTYASVYLLWNLFLAILPFFISLILLENVKAGRVGRVVLVLGLVFWILFIPNAPYVVTDLIHISRSRPVPIIFDTFLLFTSAWVGMLLYFYSFFHIEQLARMKLSPRVVSVLIPIGSLVVSFGVYLGRFLRFNSWDVFVSPSSLYGGVSKAFSQSHLGEASIFIVLSSVFIYFSYIAWKYGTIKN
jgi:uncharacterized membrane protein